MKTKIRTLLYPSENNIDGFVNETYPQSYEALKSHRILKFYRHTRRRGYLSNFYHAPFYDPNGIYYPNSEQYYQAHKFLPRYPQLARTMLCVPYPGVAYRLSGRYVAYVRKDWEEVKVDVMRRALYMKFTQNDLLRAKLMETGEAYLVEDSPIDYFWGWGADRSGQNMLGRLLMRLRETFLSETSDLDSYNDVTTKYQGGFR